MVIAINTRLWIKGQLEGIGNFIRETVLRIAREHPEHRFYLLFDRKTVLEEKLPGNVFIKEVGPPARHPLLWKIWYDVTIPLVLKKIKADLFVSLDGFCSLTTSVPQCMVVHDLGFLHQPGAYKKSHLLYLKHYTPQFLKKAATLCTVSQFSKRDIINTYPIEKEKIAVVYSGVKPFYKPLQFEEKERVREQYTGGKEYFIYVGAIQPRKNLINLLKAFSLFKKRMKSEMKLVIAGRLAWKNNEFLHLLQQYKYRSEVVLTGYLPQEELVKLTASAYALVYPSLFEGFGVPVLEGFKSGVAVLTSGESSMQEIGGEGALYFDPKDPASIAEKLMMIYRDETLRSTLIQKGLSIVPKYNWDETSALLWKAMMEARAGRNAKI